MSTPTAFDIAFSYREMETTFARMIRARLDVVSGEARMAPGVDRLDLPAFERQRALHLATASRKVRDGKYFFEPLLEKEIPKPDGNGDRTISISKIRDAVVQRRLYDYLYDVIDPMLGDDVFAYRSGRGTQDAIAAIQRHFDAGLTHAFDADLSKFFDSLDHARLRADIEALAIDPRAKALVWRFCRAGRIPSTAVRATPAGESLRTHRVPRRAGVPQGGALSGLLANLYLVPLDAAIRAAGGALVRYADDFVVLCASEVHCRQIADVVRAALLPLGIALHPTKTTEHLDAALRPLSFVGFEVQPGSLRVRQSNIQKFKRRIDRILQALARKPSRSADKHLRRVCHWLRAKIQGPDEALMAKLVAAGQVQPGDHHRRCWVGFFRGVTDDEQLARLDRWIRQQVSAHMWRVHGVAVRLSAMRRAGLPSLIRKLWLARRRPRFGGAGSPATAQLHGAVSRTSPRAPRRKVPSQGGGPRDDAVDDGGPCLPAKGEGAEQLEMQSGDRHNALEEAPPPISRPAA